MTATVRYFAVSRPIDQRKLGRGAQRLASTFAHSPLSPKDTEHLEHWAAFGTEALEPPMSLSPISPETPVLGKRQGPRYVRCFALDRN